MRRHSAVTALAIALFAAPVLSPSAAPHVRLVVARPSEPRFGVTGVVTKVDRRSKTLTIMAPTSKLTKVAQLGRTVYVDRRTHLIAIRAPVAPNAPVVRDGAVATLKNLKEGDVVRTTYDPRKPVFVGVVAVSRGRIASDALKADRALTKQGKALNPPVPGTSGR